jgi:predicted Zn-dependent protease
LGEVISQGSQFGLGTWLMKYGREYERQADIVGVQIMARAGYDPRDLAHMFETIQRQGGNGGPEWLSSHPNPGNRTQYINQEASQLRIASRPNDSGFQQTKSRLTQLGPARTMAEIERNGGAGNGGGRSGWIGGTRRRSSAAAFPSVSNRARRTAVHGERALELAGSVVEQLDQVRSAQCLRRLSGTIDADARR